MPTALVTGAAGFVGSHLTEALLERGYTVRGVDNFVTGTAQNLATVREHEAFSFTEADIRDRETMADLLDGVDTVFHQAAIASVPRSVDDPVETSDVNCTGTSVVLDCARQADVESAVVASSAAVYGSGGDLPKTESMMPATESPYGLSKYYTEQLACQAHDLYGMDTAALRYFNIFGPRQDPHGDYATVIPKFTRLMLDGQRPTIFGDGEQSRDFVYVDNVVQANIRAAESDISGEVFNVACGKRYSINDLVATVNDLLGTDIDPVHDDPRPGDIRHSVADISKARDRLDYDPSVGFEEGIERTIAYLKTA